MSKKLFPLITVASILLSIFSGQAFAATQSSDSGKISIVVGDVDGDNEVNATDYLLTKQYVTQKTKSLPVSNSEWCADVNDDNRIDIMDLLYLKKYILHYIASLPKKLDSGNFLKVQGKTIIKVGTNQPITLKGVCFSNEVWSNLKVPPVSHHSEIDYTRVKEMNMNVIRFYLNYDLFEDDSAPYKYKQSGWDWLDKNISWAKENGIYLILNMHCPQGGYQSNGNGMNLWNKPENQSRLSALWKAIAQKYKDEPTIAGYDILNEPVCPTSIDQWKTLANNIVKSIREADNKHIIIVERLNEIKSVGYSYADTNFFLIDDPNIMYTFHCYAPFDYTHQLIYWSDRKDIDGGKYPDTSIISVPRDTVWATAIFNNPALPLGDSEWTYYEGEKYQVSDPLIITGKPVICSDLNDGVSYFDNFVVKEYDERGNFIRNIYDETNTNSKSGWSYWSQDGEGTLSLCEDDGHGDSSCLAISSTKNYANASCDQKRFKVKTGYYYSISGWMKGKKVTSSDCKFRLDFEKSPSGSALMTRDKVYLESEMKNYFKWADENNVPLYAGEFGLYKACFANDKGGINWVSDMIDIFDKYNVSYTFHSYHEDGFGIYSNMGLPSDTSANTELIDLFKSRK